MNERPLIPLKTAMKASFTRVTLFGLEILAKEKKQWLEGRIVKELSFVTYLVSLYIYIYIYIYILYIYILCIIGICILEHNQNAQNDGNRAQPLNRFQKLCSSS